MSIRATVRRRPRVLLVEDRGDIFDLYAELLASAGYEVVGATDGEGAIDQTLRLLPDVILMDVGLPKLDGCEATRQLKADPRTRHIPIVMLSGYVQPHVIARAQASGCDGFLPKPVPIDQLVAEVHARLPCTPLLAPLVLVVDDDDDVRSSLCEVLRAEGFDTAEAEHGAQAIERLRHGPLPRLILLDLMMPVMDGWAFRTAQRANPAWAAIPTVVLSAVPEARQLASRLGADDYLIKPVALPLLLDTVERHAA